MGGRKLLVDVRTVVTAIFVMTEEDWGEKTNIKGAMSPRRMREPMKTNLKKSARLFQVVSEILEGCFYLSKSQPSFDS